MFHASIIWLVAGLTAFVAAAALTASLALVLARSGAVARPGPDGHGRAVARGGGLAIVVVAAVAGCVAVWAYPASQTVVVAWLLPGLTVAAVSLRDDFAPLPVSLRLAVHFAAAAALVAIVGPIEMIQLGGVTTPSLGGFGWLITLLWVIGMTNAFNFMDGIDGIAGITAAAAGAVLAFAARGTGYEPTVAIGLALAAGSIGFLTCNWQPARVFMGDVGSTFCGFTIAAIPLLVPTTNRSASLSTAILVMWPFLIDTAITLIKRVVARENILEQHCGHLYQRLVIAGWSHRAVSSLYGVLAAMCGLIAAAAVVSPPLRAAADNLTAVVIVLVPVFLVTLVQVSEARVASLAK